MERLFGWRALLGVLDRPAELTHACGGPARNRPLIGKRSFHVKTAITKMFGIRHPIIQGGMHYVGFAELASAVSNAGGLGIITGLTQKTPELLAKEIARCRDMTDKPFGVNLTFLPSFTAPPYPEYIAAIREGGVKAVETAGRSPEQYMPALKAAGIKVIHKCTSVRHSLKAEQIGCDAVSVDGFECGGHPGEDDIPNMILLPRAADELKIPFVASGGMADARSLVAALSMGAAGMNMGTRFIATKEAPVHDNVKQALVKATEFDTVLVMRALRNTERVLRNKGVDELLEIEREKGAALKIADIHAQVAGVYPKVMIDGQMHAGAWSCGLVVGLIHDIPTVKELIDRIMSEAEQIIRGRLAGLLDGTPSPRPAIPTMMTGSSARAV
jgi:NAD(P)H-dependent flavin oxidoreductase YrpB (nitropropane dioxygenase family)